MTILFRGNYDLSMKNWTKYIIYRFLSTFLARPTLESLRIRYRDFSSSSPILIYQMGKVGSHAVYTSLQLANIRHPLFHVHFLSDAGIRHTENYLRERALPIPLHLTISKALRRKVMSDKSIKWKVITLVRDPISRDVSDFFENVECYPPYLVDNQKEIRKDELVRYLQKRFAEFDESLNYTCTWFDKEIEPVFNIDVYTHPFDQEAGFTIIQHQNAEILILRLEDLSRNFNDAIKMFLQSDIPIALSQSNASREKKYSKSYQYVLEHLVLPEPILDKIYSSKYARHFYPRHLRDELSRRWLEE